MSSGTRMGLGLGLSRSATSTSANLLLDQFGGAAAAYSLQDLSSSGDTNVVRVRRSTDDTESDITAGGVTGTTLRNFTLNNDADIIRFANQANAVDKRMYFDGVNDYVSGLTVGQTGRIKIKMMLTAPMTQFGSVLGQRTVANTDEVMMICRDSSGLALRAQVNGAFTSAASITVGVIHEVEIFWGAGTAQITVDGSGPSEVSYSGTPSASATCDIGRHAGDSRYFPGVIYDVEHYSDKAGTVLVNSYQGYGNTNADWEDQVGSNDGTVNGSPALFSGQGFDAYVTTLYDQSGNGRDATQATAASQPQIVSSGSVITGSNGLPAVQFDGTDDWLKNTYGAATTAQSCFIVSDIGAASDTSGRLFSQKSGGQNDFQSTGNYIPLIRNGANESIRSFNGNTSTFVLGPAAITYDQCFLWTVTHSGSLLSGYLDGASQGTASITLNATIQNQSIGTGITGAGGSSGEEVEARLQEIIVYGSDQSSNRSAIESQLVARYGITLS